MALSLQSLFKVQHGEGAQVFLFTCIGALLVGSGIVAVSAADAALISHYGAEALGRSYIILPFVMLVVTAFFSQVSKRLGHRRCLQLMLVLQVASGVLNYFLLEYSEQAGWEAWSESIYYFIKLSAEAWTIVAYTWFWNLADEYYDVQDGKRLYGLLSAGLALGTGLGGLLIGLTAEQLGIGNLLLIGPLLGLPSVMLLYRLGKKHDKVLNAAVDEEEGGSFFALFRIFARSPFVIIVCVAAFSLMMTATCIEIIYLDIFAATYDTKALAAQLGYLFGIASAANMVLNLFFSNRLILQLGVRNVALIQPFVYLGVLAWLLIEYEFMGAVLAFMAYNILHTSIENNNQVLVLNGIPEQFRSDVRNFIEGICEPFSLALAGFLVVLCSQSTDSGESVLSGASISSVSLLFCVIGLVMTIVLRQKYQSAYLNNLRSKWLDIAQYRMSKKHRLDMTVKESAALNVYASGTDAEGGLKAIQRLFQLKPEAGVRSLVDWLERHSPDEQAIAAPFVREILHDSDGIWVPTLLPLLESEMPLHAHILLEFASLGVLSRSDIKSLTAEHTTAQQWVARIAKWHHYDVQQNKEVLDDVQAALKSGNHKEIAAALLAIGRMRDKGYAQLLAGFVQNEERDVRLAALEGLVLMDGTDVGILDDLIPCLSSHDAEQQALVLDILSAINDTKIIGPLITAAPIMSVGNRLRVESLLDGIGYRSVPYLVTLLRDSGAPFLVRSLAGRCLSRIAPQQYDVLLERLLQQVNHQGYMALEAYAHVAKQTGIGYKTLRFALRGQVLSAAAFMLEAMALAGRISDYEMLWDGLLSENEKTYANALEAIEQAFTPKQFARFRYLFNAITTREPIEDRHKYFAIPNTSLTDILSICEDSQSLPMIARLAARMANGTAIEEHKQYVHWMDRMLQEPFFAEIELTSLEILISSAAQQKISLANCFDPVQDGIAYVLDGDMFASLDDASSMGQINAQVKPASFVGLDVLWGASSNVYSSRAGADIIVFPWQSVKFVQSVSPQMNRALLQRAVGVK